MKLEDKFLLLGARKTLNESEFNEFDLLINSIENWEEVFIKSNRMAVSSLLYKNIVKSKNRPSVPSEILEKFKRKYLKTLINNTKLNQDLLELTEKLNSNNIPCIPLKGVSLNMLVYDDFGLRPMADIDLLVKKNDLEKAKNIMVADGWKINEEPFRTKTHQEIHMIVAHDPYLLWKGNALVELHIGIHPKFARYNIEINDYWERSGNSILMNKNISILNSTDMLQHLCLHTFIDFLSGTIRLKSFVDINEYLKKYKNEINWDLLKITSEKYSCLNQVQQILKLCHTYFNSPIDLSFINKLLEEKDNNKPWYKINYDSLFLNMFEKNAYSKMFYFLYGHANKRFLYREIKGVKSKIIFFVGYIFPSKDFVIYRLKNKNKSKLHFQLYRFFRIIN